FRRSWEALDGPPWEGPLVRMAVELAERLADGKAGRREGQRFTRAAYAHRSYAYGNGHDHVNVAESLVSEDIQIVVGNSAYYSLALGMRRTLEWERAAQDDIRRDIYGGPVALEPAWLTSAVVSLARAAYQERASPSGELELARLAVLSDALEEAGCADAELLGHLRSPGPHVRGCWAVDLLTGRE